MNNFCEIFSFKYLTNIFSSFSSILLSDTFLQNTIQNTTQNTTQKNHKVTFILGSYDNEDEYIVIDNNNNKFD
jgi:hypothetical protein